MIQSCSVLLWKAPPSPLQDGLPCEWNSALPERPRVQFKGWRWKHHRAAATQPRPLGGRSLLHEPNNKTSRWDALWEDAAFGTEHYRSALHTVASAPPPHQGSWIPIWNVLVCWIIFFFFCVCWNLSSAPSSWYYKFAIWGTIYYELLHNFDPGYHYKIMLKTRREILKRNIIQSVQRRHRIQVSVNFAGAGVLRPATPAGNQRGADMSCTCSPGIEYLDTLNEKWCVDRRGKHCFSPRTKNKTHNHG